MPAAGRTDGRSGRPAPAWVFAGQGEPTAWSSGFLPWPARACVPGNLAPGAVAANLAPASSLRAPNNLLAEQNVLVALTRRSGPDGRRSAPGWVQALDVPIQFPGAPGGPVTPRRLFAAARRRGLRGHAGHPRRDPYAAAELVNLATRARGTTPEETAAPSAQLGLVEGTWPRTEAMTQEGVDALGAFQRWAIQETGTGRQMAEDVAAMKVGRVRRLKQRDLSFACLFPQNELDPALFLYGAEVPAPGDLLAELRQGGVYDATFGRFAPVEELVWWCRLLGVRLDLTPFNGGGGIDTNYTTRSVGRIPVNSVTSSSTLYSDVAAGKPGWQTGFMIPSGLGWSAFYQDSEEVGEEPVGDDAIYQHYATALWPTGVGVSRASPYARECHRRKCLGLAAFAQGVGEWLAAMEATLDDLGLGALATVIDTIEVGNELDGFWEMNGPARSEGAREAARYIALLAGPIKAAVPAMRFRTELHGWARVAPPLTNWDDLRAWLTVVMEDGLRQEAAWWERVQLHQVRRQIARITATAPPVDEGADAWLASCAAAGFQWPPAILPRGETSPTLDDLLIALRDHTPLRPTDLLHEVGTHFYHYKDRNDSGRASPKDYADAAELAANLRDLTDLGTAFAPGTTVSAGEMGFPAHSPGAPSTRWEDGYYDRTTPTFQAAMYVRLLAAALGAGARMAALFCFKYGAAPSDTGYRAGYTFSDWHRFFTMGVHNDVAGPAATYAQLPDCWRRPSWYATRRLAWLLGASASVRIGYASRGTTCVRFELSPAVGTRPDGTAFTRPWSRAWLVWLDQYSDSLDLHPPSRLGGTTARLVFSDPGRTGFELVSMVPEVAPQLTPECHGPQPWCLVEGGYPAPSSVAPNPDWLWPGWDAALGAHTTRGPAFALTLKRTVLADPVPVVAPLCLFTDAELEHVR